MAKKLKALPLGRMKRACKSWPDVKLSQQTKFGADEQDLCKDKKVVLQ